MKTLYVSDLDGTLLGSDARLSAFAISTLNRLSDEGMCITYATARSLASATQVTRGWTLRHPVIVNNGVFTLRADSGEIYDAAFFSREQANDILRFLLDASLYPLVYAHIDGTERVSYLAGRENQGIAAYLRSRRADARLRPVECEADLFTGDIFYFNRIGDEHDLRLIHDRFADDPELNCILQADIYNRTEYWCELMPKSATKGNAILRLKQSLHCDRVVCFGDGLNDLPMFAISDECYAVENAADEVKRAATQVIPANTDDGVVRFLAMIPH